MGVTLLAEGTVLDDCNERGMTIVSLDWILDLVRSFTGHFFVKLEKFSWSCD